MKKADATSQELNTMGLRLYVNAENPGGIIFYEMCGYEHKFDKSMLMQKEWWFALTIIISNCIKVIVNTGRLYVALDTIY